MHLKTRQSLMLIFVSLAGTGWFLAAPLKTLGATTNTIRVLDNNFSPQSVTNRAGDTVKWSWEGINSHSSTGSGISPLWDSGIHATGFTFAHQFPAAGTFPYRCVVHSQQTATVTVRPLITNTPLAITIAAPLRITESSFQFSFTTTPGLKYVVRRSTTPFGWIPIGTNTALSTNIVFEDTTATNVVNFYSVSVPPGA